LAPLARLNAGVSHFQNGVCIKREWPYNFGSIFPRGVRLHNVNGHTRLLVGEELAAHPNDTIGPFLKLVLVEVLHKLENHSCTHYDGMYKFEGTWCWVKPGWI
jgi:hypothetical protein